VRSVAPLLALVVVLSCSVTPLTSKIRVGEEPIVIGVGEGTDRQTDLFAAPAGGGSFTRLTFTRAEERTPRLSPGGTMVAFLRRTGPEDQAWSLVILDLLNNSESATPVSKAAGQPAAIGWSANGEMVVVRGEAYLVSQSPPRPVWLRPVPLDSIGWADSLTGGLLGDPPRAKIAGCGGGFCIVSGVDTTRLQGVTNPIPWGTDSIGYFTESQEWEVRPLAGGHLRRPVWTEVPARLRELTYQGGSR